MIFIAANQEILLSVCAQFNAWQTAVVDLVGRKKYFLSKKKTHNKQVVFEENAFNRNMLLFWFNVQRQLHLNKYKSTWTSAVNILFYCAPVLAELQERKLRW